MITARVPLEGGESSLAAWIRRRRSLIWLAIGVLGSWCVVFGLVGSLAPAPAGASHDALVGMVPGGVASIKAPPHAAWPLPSDRQTFDDYWTAFHEDDEGALTETGARPGWFTVSACQRVRVIGVDGESDHIEVLDGPGAGRRGWLKRWQLQPLCPA